MSGLLLWFEIRIMRLYKFDHELEPTTTDPFVPTKTGLPVPWYQKQCLLLETKFSNKRTCWGSFTLSALGTFCHPKHKFYPVSNSMPTFPGPGTRSSYSELRLLWIKVNVNINVLTSSMICTLSSFECILRSRKSASNGTSMYHCAFPLATLKKLYFLSNTLFPACYFSYSVHQSKGAWGGSMLWLWFVFPLCLMVPHIFLGVYWAVVLFCFWLLKQSLSYPRVVSNSIMYVAEGGLELLVLVTPPSGWKDHVLSCTV